MDSIDRRQVAWPALLGRRLRPIAVARMLSNFRATERCSRRYPYLPGAYASLVKADASRYSKVERAKLSLPFRTSYDFRQVFSFKPDGWDPVCPRQRCRVFITGQFPSTSRHVKGKVPSRRMNDIDGPRPEVHRNFVPILSLLGIRKRRTCSDCKFIMKTLRWGSRSECVH